VKGGLAGRMLAASALLALVVGAAFAVLLASVGNLREAQRRAQHSQEVLVAAGQLERLITDLEIGPSEFIITRQEEFLQPWQAAQASFPGQATALEQLVADNPQQQARAEKIKQDVADYIRLFSVPLVEAARRGPASVTPAVATDDEQHARAIRVEFVQFETTERDLAAARQSGAETAADHAVLAAAGGLTASTLLLAAFLVGSIRTILRPIRGVAAMASRLSDGDLTARVPEPGVGEIGVLQRCFNTMAASLENSRAQLAASRARIVTAADHARRRIERDLHDGIQQRLVSLLLDLRAAEAAVPPELPQTRAQLAGVADGLAGAFDELREISRGVHPSILSEGGLAPALKALARHSSVPVEFTVDVPARLPEQVEVGAYYVVSEALTNTAKHAHASVVQVDAQSRNGTLHLSIRDDGIGGADPTRGSGLIGLTDRVQTLGGTISVTSAPEQGTTLLVELPADGR
jgi:signal transduction histidine kinase